MCTLENIKLGSAAIFTIRLLLGLTLMIIGGIFASTPAIVQGYGVYFIEAGSGVVMLGFTTLLFAYPMLFAIRKHNRFVLLSCIVIDMIIFSQEISVGLKTYEPTISIFSSTLMSDCALHNPVKYTNEECLVYWRSDRTAGFRIVWASLFTDVNNEDNFQVLSNFESTSGCCGFASPMSCQNDSRKWPSDRPLDAMHTRYQKQRLSCGEMPGFYEKQTNCLDYYDENSLPPIVGGCRYDMGAGNCRNQDVTDFTKGCALAVEEYVAAQVQPLSVLLMIMSTITFLCLLVNCCMLWKRKDIDVFPEFIHVNQTKSKWSNYHRIKDNVVVIPTKDYLYLRGFLPKPEHMKHHDHQHKHELHPFEEKKEGDEQPPQEASTPATAPADPATAAAAAVDSTTPSTPTPIPTTPQNKSKLNAVEQKV